MVKLIINNFKINVLNNIFYLELRQILILFIISLNLVKSYVVQR